MFNQKGSPYKGQLIATAILVMPPLLLTWIFYSVIKFYQPAYGFEINIASSKILGCGLGMIFHLSCWIAGAFSNDLKVVKTRLKEFFSDLFLSPRLAFVWYWEDIKSNGIAFWIDFTVITANIYILIDAILDFLSLRGFFI